MFINITNHPSSDWSEEQLNAARSYGKIVDIPFPNVKPDFTPANIGSLADALVEYVKTLCEAPVVHVMGELTFTYAVVSRLKALGITCLASTTERNAVIASDGKKVSKFKFVQFREY